MLQIDVVEKLKSLIHVPAPALVPTPQPSGRGARGEKAGGSAVVTALASDMTLMLLAIVAYAADELSQTDRSNIVVILKALCVKG